MTKYEWLAANHTAMKGKLNVVNASDYIRAIALQHGVAEHLNFSEIVYSGLVDDDPKINDWIDEKLVELRQVIRKEQVRVLRELGVIVSKPKFEQLEAQISLSDEALDSYIIFVTKLRAAQATEDLKVESRAVKRTFDD